MSDNERFLDALASCEPQSRPGVSVSVEDVARRAAFDRTEAIRLCLELIDANLVAGVQLVGDDEVKSINGLRLTGVGRERTRRQQAERFLRLLERESSADSHAAMSAAALGATIGWPEAMTNRVADTLCDYGLAEYIEMGSDLLSLTSAGRSHLNRMEVQEQEEGRMASVSINREAIAQMMRDIQGEFNKHRITLPLHADGPVSSGNTTIYNGPVIHGDANGAQLAWHNDNVSQHQEQQIASGYETLAQALVSTLEQLPSAGLEPIDRDDAESAAREALRELTRPEPDPGVLRRSVAAVKGHLALLAAGLIAGAEQGAQNWAKTAIEHLHL